MWAGVARAEITDPDAQPVNDPLYVKALVLENEFTTIVVVTVDAVAIAEIGSIGNDYLANVRSELCKRLDLKPENFLINASHCHGSVCADVERRTVRAVEQAWHNLVPVVVGVGTGCEDRIMENRRLKLKGGREADVRRAYSLAPDEQVLGVGSVDPQIGMLRLDRLDGQPLAVIYNFACHPIQGVPNGGNTADLVGFASNAIESSLGEGVSALFLQGCAGDVNPAGYKDVGQPRNAEFLGNLLGLSTVRALRQIHSRADSRLKVVHEVLELPMADLSPPIKSLQAEQARLLASLRGTTLNLKTFLSLFVKYRLFRDYPSSDSHRYLHQRALDLDALDQLDEQNTTDLEHYTANIHAMEELTRIQVNLELLKRHQTRYAAAAKKTIEAEVLGLRIGEFVLIAFPGELSVQIGLGIKSTSPHRFTFVSGCSNGYLYYAPTAAQLKNRGWAQEDSDCLLAPEWQTAFETQVTGILERL